MSCGHLPWFWRQRLVDRGVREQPEADSGKGDERLTASLARSFVQHECDRVVELSEQLVGEPDGTPGCEYRGKTREQRFDRRSCGARQAEARLPDIDDVQRRPQLAKIGGVAPRLGGNRGNALGQQSE